MAAARHPAASPLTRLAAAAKAAGHPARLRILAMLRAGPLCVCQMTAVLGRAASTVSGHLADLRRAGLVAEHKQGKWVEYSLAPDADAAALLAALLPGVAADPRARADAVLVRRLRSVSRETLCTVGVVVRTPAGVARVGGRPPASRLPAARPRRRP